jgi:hypothetical protein
MILAVDWWHVVKLAAALLALGTVALIAVPFLANPWLPGPARVIRNAKKAPHPE